MNSETLRLWLGFLLIKGMVPSWAGRLTQAIGSPSQVWGTAESELSSRFPRLPDKIKTGLRSWRDGRLSEPAQLEEAYMAREGIQLALQNDADYPPLLREIPTSPPALFYRGSPNDPNPIPLAVVGTRSCDSYGMNMTRELVAALCREEVTIVSGLALGIDGVAHQAALAAAGQTWGFLPCGFDRLYPSEHRELADRIAAAGCLYTEFPSSTPPVRSFFAPRNRLLAGCSRGTLVIQGKVRSGALITARYAMEYNREVFALPGRANEQNSAGPHSLIQDGAKLVVSVEDILTELNIAPGIRSTKHPLQPAKPGTQKQPVGTSDRPVVETSTVTGHVADPQPKATTDPVKELQQLVHEQSDTDDKRILLRLEHGDQHIDRLSADLDLPVAKLSQRLLLLEMQGVIERLPGMRFDLKR